MSHCAMLQSRLRYSSSVISMTLLLFGCGTIPRHYVRVAEPGATLTAMSTHPEQYPPQSGVATSPTAPTIRKGVQIPLAEVDSSNDAYIRATGYGTLATGPSLCQHSADLAARVELSKLARVQVREKSVDRIRERTGRDAEQDIEVVREGLVDQVLSDVRIVSRSMDQAAGICASTAEIPKRNLFPAPQPPTVKNSAGQ